MGNEKESVNFTFTKSKIEKYDIRWSHGEWAMFSIDEKTGMMQCLSSFGNWSYAWPNHGRKTFKHFLLEMERDWEYLLRKTSNKVFDFDKSIAYWKNHIFDLRRDGDCTKEQAREAFDVIDSLETDDAGYCAAVLNESQAISEVDPDFWELLGGIKCYSSKDIMFAKTIWPMFCEIIRSEIGEQDGK